jgi:uncharacterized membrane protein
VGHPVPVREQNESGAEAAALERIVFFSDAVFAIAITLLVIQIPIPSASEHDLAGALADLGPQFFSFGLSFLVIGQFWVAHHRMFRYITRFDAGLVWLNLGLLLCVAFLPFPTALLGEHDTDRTAIVFYALAMFLTGLASAGVWHYATFRHRCVGADLDRRRVHYLSRRSLVVPAVFIVTLPVALWNASAAKAVWFAPFPAIAAVRRRHRDVSRDAGGRAVE